MENRTDTVIDSSSSSYVALTVRTKKQKTLKTTCHMSNFFLYFLHSIHLSGEKYQSLKTGQELLDSQFIGKHCIVIQPVSEFLAGVQYLRKDVILGVVFEFLFQKCYPDVFQKGDFPAGIGFVVTRKYAQQCRFSSSVRCDERNLVPFIYIESDMLEQHFRTITLADVFYL